MHPPVGGNMVKHLGNLKGNTGSKWWMLTGKSSSNGDLKGKLVFEWWFEGVITNKERLVTLNGVETRWNYDTPSKMNDIL